MQIIKAISCFMLMSVCVRYIYAQTVQPVASNNNLLFGNTEYIKTDSGLIINQYFKNGCKNYSVKSHFKGDSVKIPLELTATIYKEPAKPKFVIVHGNVSYDFFYRSKIDTPFAQQNLQQHTERVWLDVLFREKYPFKVGFTARESNSPFFKDMYSMNFNFDRYGYTKNLKQDLLNRLQLSKWQNPNLKLVDTILKEQLKQYQALKNWINGPEALQKLIEAKEKLFYYNQKKIGGDTDNATQIIPVSRKIKLGNGQWFNFKKDSVIAKTENGLPKPDSSFIKLYQSKKDQLNKLEKTIVVLEHQSDSLKKSITQGINKIKQLIYQVKTPTELDKIAIDNSIQQPKKEKLQNVLTNVKSFGIGRSMVDYTALTAQNIMLTGVNIEYNPSYYAAFAAGKIDYGFRDFFGRSIKQKNQYLVLGRMGWGDKDKHAVILTVFNGRKNNYAGLLAADSNNNTATLFGYSVETIIRKNENTFLSVEVAKSTKTKVTGLSTADNKSDNLFKYNDDTNLGINVNAQTIITETDTRLSGYYRKTGEQFQSFSLLTYNTNQQSWQVRADQSFLKRKITVTGMLRQNDFTNPLSNKTFETNTVFKSLLVNAKLPHWPIVNAGYYPGTQFYIVDQNTVRENAYYILNGSVLYPYKFKGLTMNSAVVYNRYFNQATDSGFVLYKGVNYIVSQSAVINKLQVEGSYSFNKQAELNYYTLDAKGDYNLKKYLKIGGGVKYNHVLSGNDYWGHLLKISADFKKLGTLQLSYEKSYLPTIQQTLYPVEIGRVSWYKIF